MGTVLLDLGGDRVPNRLHQQKNPAKKGGRISSLLRARVTGSSTQTDTPSFVSVAVSEARPRFATHFATDQRLGSAESVSNSHPVGEGGRGSVDWAGGIDSIPVRAFGILLANDPAGFRCPLSNAGCSAVRTRKTAGGTSVGG